MHYIPKVMCCNRLHEEQTKKLLSGWHEGE